MHLSVDNLSIQRGERDVLTDISFTANGGEFIGLVGPNGAGKTSLMRAMLGLLAHQGHCSLSDLSIQEKAKTTSWLPQTRDIAWPMSVKSLIALGRQPHSTDDATNEAAISQAIQDMELGDFIDRPATELSGGETARALIARCLAQTPALFMADEPLAGLDMAHQISALELFRKKADAGGLIISSIHDVGLAARYCTRFILLGDTQLLADGVPLAIMKDPLFADIFSIDTIFATAEDGTLFMPKKRSKTR